MNKLLKQFTIILGLSIALFATGCGDDIDDLVTSIETDRLLSPIDLEARIVNQTGVRLSWKSLKESNNITYNVEVYQNGTEDYTGTPIRTITGITSNEIPYTITGFDGDAAYSVRVQAVSEGVADSKWTGTAFKTDTEQIFQAVDVDNDLEATQVTLRWPAGETATNILVTPGDINYVVTAANIASGAATITGLTGETEYTAVLMNGSKVRGTIKFTTLIDLGDASAIYPEDDIIAILDAAEDGDSFVLFPGEYTLGDYAITKSLSLSGYKSTEKPIIYGRFTFGADISILELKTLIMDGQNTMINPFEASAACTVGSLTVTGSEFRDYTRAVIYNNSAANFGDITISDCIFTNFPGDGGDGIDFRGGSLNSFTVENTTFDTGFRAFVRMQVACNMAFRNCTFYRVASFNNSNNSGLFRISGGTLEVSKCLFVETGVEGTEYGNWCKNANNMGATPTYSQNYYYNCYNLWAGLYTNPASCSATEANPGFKDAENGDFTLSNEDLIYNKIGDPRWIP